MRCKNCGLDNDENLYICQNCGSPLYDEADFEDNNDNETTKQIDKVVPTPTPAQTEDEKKKKQLNILIIALCVLLVAIIIGIVAVVASNNGEDETTTQTTTTTEESTTQSNITTIEPTTTTTTEPTTTTTTTTTTTEPALFNVSISNNAGGSVEGAGKYERGKHITVIAIPDEGYEFDGWYSGNTLLSTRPSYTFTVTQDTQLQAIFAVVQEEPEESTEPIEIIEGGIE